MSFNKCATCLEEVAYMTPTSTLLLSNKYATSTQCLNFTKTIKNSHFSMCRTFSPYKMRGIYFSL